MHRPKILLIYIGKEQGSWGTTAYPKPAHYYIMPGILYCAGALGKAPWINKHYEVSYRYFNRTMESQDELLQCVLAEQAACIGFSVYCWNSEDTFGLARRIRAGTTANLYSVRRARYYHERPFRDNAVFQKETFCRSACFRGG